MPSDMLRVGVIGAGRMGERHCRVYSGLSGVEFAGISERSPQRGAAISGKYGVPCFEEFTDLLDRVDAVSVASPTASHFGIAAECLRRGVHVLIEKPLAGSVAEARALARVARDSSVVVQVGHIERFNPAFLELQAILGDMEVVAVNARRLSPADTSNTDVDVVFDLMIHDIDLVLTLLGPGVESIQAAGRSPYAGGADHVVASLSMARGPLVSLAASRITEQKVRQIEVTALGAYVDVDLLNKNVCIYRRTMPEYITNHHRPLRYRQENVVERIFIPTAEPLQLELQDFVDCVREGREPKVSVEDGLRALEVAAAIRERVHAARGVEATEWTGTAVAGAAHRRTPSLTAPPAGGALAVAGTTR